VEHSGAAVLKALSPSGARRRDINGNFFLAFMIQSEKKAPAVRPGLVPFAIYGSEPHGEGADATVALGSLPCGGNLG
jgi:hypothetical protein